MEQAEHVLFIISMAGYGAAAVLYLFFAAVKKEWAGKLAAWVQGGALLTHTASIVLLRRKVSAGLLLGPEPANAYLPFPFLPEELVGLISQTEALARDTGPLTWGDVTVVPARFCIEATLLRLTVGEVSLLRSLTESAVPAAGAVVPYVNALNAKFARAGKKTRIVYRSGEGYRLVI